MPPASVNSGQRGSSCPGHGVVTQTMSSPLSSRFTPPTITRTIPASRTKAKTATCTLELSRFSSKAVLAVTGVNQPTQAYASDRDGHGVSHRADGPEQRTYQKEHQNQRCDQILSVRSALLGIGARPEESKPLLVLSGYYESPAASRVRFRSRSNSRWITFPSRNVQTA